MGEISFLYQTKPVNQSIHSFSYWYNKSIEYSFAYQRYISLSDTSIYNSPVAITKVATGLYNLQDLFVTHRKPMIPEELDGVSVSKNPKDTRYAQQETVKQEGHSFIDNLHTLVPYNVIFDKHLEMYQEQKEAIKYFYLNEDVRKKTSQILTQRDRYGFNILPMYLGVPYDKHANYYDNINASIDRYSFNILPMYYGWREDPQGYYYYGCFGRRPDPIGNKITNDMAHRPVPVLNILKVMLAKNTNMFVLNKINIYPSIFYNYLMQTLHKN